MANVPTILVDFHANVRVDLPENDAILKWVHTFYFLFSLSFVNRILSLTVLRRNSLCSTVCSAFWPYRHVRGCSYGLFFLFHLFVVQTMLSTFRFYYFDLAICQRKFSNAISRPVKKWNRHCNGVNGRKKVHCSRQHQVMLAVCSAGKIVLDVLIVSNCFETGWINKQNQM